MITYIAYHLYKHLDYPELSLSSYLLLQQSAVRALGRLDVLVNNAGVTLFDDIAAMETADIIRLLHLDFRAPILLMQHVGRHMIERGIQGCMINITSTRVERVYPRDAVYGGVKAALARASQSAALELSAYGIRINCIAPGAIAATKEREAHYLALGRKIRLGRPGRPVGQTANIHLDLASPNFGVQEWSEFSERMREVFPAARRCAAVMCTSAASQAGRRSGRAARRAVSVP